jgi:hypothetical protein
MGRLSFLQGLRSTLVAAALVVGCGGALGGPMAGGESHFLATCDGSCAEGLSCISGICTRGCVVGTDTCDDLAATAECTDQSVEPGAVAVCDVSCMNDSECQSLGAGYSCESGFCRGGESSGGGSTGGSSSGGASAGGTGGVPPLPGYSGASCRVNNVDYPSGSAYINAPNQCGSCTCLDGELTCDAVDCAVPALQCPEEPLPSDAVDVEKTRIDGNRLIMQVAYGGGCERHDFSLCYGPGFSSSYPVQMQLTLNHDAHDDGCEAYLSEVIEFDLGILAEEYKLAFEPDGGLIETNYGMYAFGELMCAERTQAAWWQLDQAIAFADKSCTTSADCRLIDGNTSCARGCNAVVSAAGAADLESWIDEIETTVCGDFASTCDDGALNTCTTNDVAVDCVQGTCQVL